jgi:bifunctional enzyme CysN/CysC
MMNKERDQMNVVIVGHVDHGKSTLIGRLLADTGALPKGKLEAVKANCARNAKPFEYAFLLDALKDEQSQGITIDTARSFFKSKERDYIIIDAPGHIEFLKNMVTGAARAEAAVLVIDAHEGIQENSKRHGYMMSFLGIRNITVCVNKMDLVQYKQEVFDRIRKDYVRFLEDINIQPANFIPVSAREGDNIAARSKQMPWYNGANVLEALDGFVKAAPKHERYFRFPVQDIYKFTAQGDDRRIAAGRIESGSIRKGDEVIFFPSQKRSRIKNIEGFNVNGQHEAIAGQSAGFTFETQIYIRPGDIMAKVNDKHPHVTTKIKANLFWMGRQPLVKGKTYKLKITTQHVPVVLSEILNVLDASELSSITNKQQIDRHDVAECILETLKPVAFDEVVDIPETGRFVIVDNYEISGGGIILAPVYEAQGVLSEYVRRRDYEWVRSEITPEKRAVKNQHKSALIIISGEENTGKQRIAKALEEELFRQGKSVYFLGVSNRLLTGQSDFLEDKTVAKIEHIRQLGEMAHIFNDAGLILITSLSNIDEYELDMLKSLNQPRPTLVVNVGESTFTDGSVDLTLAKNQDPKAAVGEIIQLLIRSVVLDPEYSI